MNTRNESIINQPSKTKNPQQSSLISMKIKIQTTIQQETNWGKTHWGKKNSGNVWFYRKNKTCPITTCIHPVVDRCDMSNPQSQISGISKPCCTQSTIYRIVKQAAKTNIAQLLSEVQKSIAFQLLNLHTPNNVFLVFYKRHGMHGIKSQIVFKAKNEESKQ